MDTDPDARYNPRADLVNRQWSDRLTEAEEATEAKSYPKAKTAKKTFSDQKVNGVVLHIPNPPSLTNLVNPGSGGTGPGENTGMGPTTRRP